VSKTYKDIFVNKYRIYKEEKMTENFQFSAQIQKMADRKSATTQNRSFAYRSFA